MPRYARQQAESGYYHVVKRGVGKRCIFEDDKDRLKFLDYLKKHSKKNHVAIIAWVLMSNHFHLLIQADLPDMKSFMRGLGTSYAQYFNGVHTHVGHVFQGRYSSFPVESDEQLLATIRYIHLNPFDVETSDIEAYKWSSYLQYLGNEGICSLDDIKLLFGNADAIREFHKASCSDTMVSLCEYRPRIDDAEALNLVHTIFGSSYLDGLAHMQIEERNEALRKLYAIGLSMPQISRLTGLGRGIVQRVCKAR